MFNALILFKHDEKEKTCLFIRFLYLQFKRSHIYIYIQKLNDYEVINFRIKNFLIHDLPFITGKSINNVNFVTRLGFQIRELLTLDNSINTYIILIQS